ncbi:MAG: chemotaxis response regulator protein-glutamate methylesterase [Candidatus Riflebacteria bacterium]|nr:chemotaxis response regulator protein-glutamate methylesterase [Candidatus Riflebacteria bacterium]
MALGKKIRVLIVEDSAFMRKALREMLETDPLIEVLPPGRDGKDGLQKARELKPDVITMDINMPEMDGLTCLQHINHEGIAPVIMVSSLTQEGAVTTFEALELGAFDFIPKPSGTISFNIKKATLELLSKIKSAAKMGILQKLKSKLDREKLVPSPRASTKQVSEARSSLSHSSFVTKAIALGISTGGPKTLSDVISSLPGEIGAPFFMVQHMPETFTASFAARLNSIARFPVKEVASGDIVQRNHGYLAKGGQHLLLRKKNNGEIMIRLASTPENLFVPSVGVMMDSVLEVFGRKMVAVMMTGMGDDGADSMLRVRQAGGITIAESEETAIVFGMPKEAIDRGGVEIVAPSYDIPEKIMSAIKKL